MVSTPARKSGSQTPSSLGVPSTSSSNLQDCVAMIEDILLVFQGNDDTGSVDEIRDKAQNFRENSKSYQNTLGGKAEELKSNINGMQKDMQQLELDSKYDYQYRDLEGKKKGIILDIMQLEEDCTSKESEIKRLKEEAGRVRSQIQMLEKEMDKEVPRRGNLRGLYASITNVKFDKVPSSSDKVSGCIVRSNPPGFKTFESPTEPSANDVNALWDQVAKFL